MIVILKRWIIAGILLLLTAGLLLPWLAADTHFLILRELGSMTLNPLQGWKLILSDSRILGFYLIYTAATALMLIWVLVGSTYLNYRSNMQRITPDIITPCADGQGQFGTARWMKPESIGRFFDVWKIPKRQVWFQQLIAAGQSAYKEVQDSDVKVDSYDPQG